MAACTDNIQPISSTVLFIQAKQTKIIQAEVLAISDLGQANNCTLTLSDAVGNTLDTYDLEFNTTTLQNSNR